MILQGHEVEYIDEGHLYLVDGVIVPSVSQVLRGKYGGEYATVAPAVLKRSAELGTQMHKAIQDLVEGDKKSDLPEVRNYKFLMKLHKLKAVECEKIVLIDCNGFTCGRLDMVVKNDKGEFGIIDFKRRSTLNKSEIAEQLNMYRLGYNQCYKRFIAFIGVMQLKGDVRKYIEMPVDEEYIRGVLNERKNESV